MPTLLIADASDIFIERIRRTFGSGWEIDTARDGNAVAERLREHCPDVLLLNLALPDRDGLSILKERFPEVPPVILALTTATDEGTFRAAAALGVGCILPIPARPEYVADRLLDMYAYRNAPPSRVTKHLDTLGIRPNLSGYRCLAAAIVEFSRDPNRLLKEIYPEVAKKCALLNATCVERVCRRALHDAWERRNKKIWALYFPGASHCPSCKELIATVAQMLW